MNKWVKVGIVGLLVVGAFSALIAGVALAQDETPVVPEGPLPHAEGWGMGREMGDQVEFEVTQGQKGLQANNVTKL